MNPDADQYSCNNAFQKDVAKRVLVRFQPRNHGSYPLVMDMGCGTGEVTNMVHKELPGVEKLVAFDKNLRAVNYALANNQNDGIKYEVVDIEDPRTLKQEWTGLFNMVTSFHVLDWISDQQKALAIIKKVLRPGGEFLLAIGFSRGLTDTPLRLMEDPKWNAYLKGDFGLFPPWMYKPDWKNGNRWGTDPVSTYSDFIQSAGLKLAVIEVIDHTFEFPNNESCRGFLEGFLKCPEEIPKDMVSDFIDDVAVIFKDTACLKSSDGKCLYTENILYVHGWKEE